MSLEWETVAGIRTRQSVAKREETMALSEHEQRLLDEMERRLYEKESDFVSTTPQNGGSLSARTVVLVLLSVAVGLGIVLLGLAIQQPLVGLGGFLVMLLGVFFVTRRKRTKGDAGSDDWNRAGAKASGSNKDTSFLNKLEDRWDRRQRGE